jgi:hypothetical protein
VRGGIFFHAIDKDLPLGTPERKIPLALRFLERAESKPL